MVEKAVDVMLAVDLVAMAIRNEYEAAYVLSADGDYTPAVEIARSLGKKVYAAAPPEWGCAGQSRQYLHPAAETVVCGLLRRLLTQTDPEPKRGLP